MSPLILPLVFLSSIASAAPTAEESEASFAASRKIFLRSYRNDSRDWPRYGSNSKYHHCPRWAWQNNLLGPEAADLMRQIDEIMKSGLYLGNDPGWLHLVNLHVDFERQLSEDHGRQDGDYEGRDGGRDGHFIADLFVELERSVAAELGITHGAVARAIPLILQPDYLLSAAYQDALHVGDQLNLYSDAMKDLVIARIAELDPFAAYRLRYFKASSTLRAELLQLLDVEELDEEFRAQHPHADPALLALRFSAPGERAGASAPFISRVERFAGRYVPVVTDLERMEKDLERMQPSTLRDAVLVEVRTLSRELREDFRRVRGRVLEIRPCSKLFEGQPKT